MTKLMRLVRLLCELPGFLSQTVVHVDKIRESTNQVERIGALNPIVGSEIHHNSLETLVGEENLTSKPQCKLCFNTNFTKVKVSENGVVFCGPMNCAEQNTTKD